jgi:hypothetical protein
MCPPPSYCISLSRVYSNVELDYHVQGLSHPQKVAVEKVLRKWSIPWDYLLFIGLYVSSSYWLGFDACCRFIGLGCLDERYYFVKYLFCIWVVWSFYQCARRLSVYAFDASDGVLFVICIHVRPVNQRQEDIIWPINQFLFFMLMKLLQGFLVWQKLSLVCNLSDAFYIFVAVIFFALSH